MRPNRGKKVRVLKSSCVPAKELAMVWMFASVVLVLAVFHEPFRKVVLITALVILAFVVFWVSTNGHH